jgi:SprT protein
MSAVSFQRDHQECDGHRPPLQGRQLELFQDRSGSKWRGADAPGSQYAQAPNVAVVVATTETKKQAVDTTASTFLKRGRDAVLEGEARTLLVSLGAESLAAKVRVEWHSRLRTCAGKADTVKSLILLNPRLRDHGAAEIDRTLRHELAHLLAQSRVGRRRLLPHGPEWRKACHDLAIGDETRCHNLPFAISRRARRFLYRCPKCRREFPRARRIRRSIACLACCRAHNRGKFDPRFRLKLIDAPAPK